MKQILKKKVNVFGKGIPVFAIAILSLALVSAALLTYFGQVITTVNVEQGLYLDGKAWNDPIIEEPVTMYSIEAKTISSPHYLENKANVDVKVSLNTVCTAIYPHSCDDIVTKYKGITLEVTQDSGQNEINKETLYKEHYYLPHIDWVINGGEIQLTFVNPTANMFVFDYRVDSEEGESHDYSHIVISGGELVNELIGDRYNWVVVSPGTSKVITVTPQEEVWAGLRVGAENDWYLNWIIFEFPELSQPITVPAGETLDFAIVSEFPLGTYPGEYTLTTQVQLA